MITPNVSIVRVTILISGLNNEKVKVKSFYLYYILHSCTCCVVVADMVMENIKQRALKSFSHPPIFWNRYVDDTCVALLPSLVDSFYQHLNSIEPSIQFTVEIENNDCLPFLDILITRDSDGSFIIHHSLSKNRTTL